MSKSKRWSVGVVVALALFALACGSFAPPESCGEDIGGTADEALFAEHFTQMDLVVESTGASGEPDDEMGEVFTSGDGLVIRAESLGEVSVRACVQPRSGGGQIPFDETETLAEGEDTFSLGSFDEGSYVIRVIVDGTLVRNLVFGVE